MAKSKRDFTKINNDALYNAIEEATAEPAPAAIRPRKRDTPPTEEEIQAAREQSRTRGRKGIKMLRVNMAFTPEVHDYIRIMAQAHGQTITQFTNAVFKNDMKRNADIYDQIKALRERLENG